MDKIIKITIGLIMLCGCYDGSSDLNSKYNMVVFYNPWISFDFNSKILKVDFNDLHYRDTIQLSEGDEAVINNSFKKNEIRKLTGEVSYFGSTIIMPPSGLTIKIYSKNKLLSETFIADNYDGTYRDVYQTRAISFRNDIVRILDSNVQIKKAIDVLNKKQSTIWEEHMIKSN